MIITLKFCSESFSIECNHCIQIEYNNNTLTCPRTKGTMNKLLLPLTYPFLQYILFCFYKSNTTFLLNTIIAFKSNIIIIHYPVWGPKIRWINFHHRWPTLPPLTYPFFLDSERSEECIVFTMMFIYLFIFFYPVNRILTRPSAMNSTFSFSKLYQEGTLKR